MEASTPVRLRLQDIGKCYAGPVLTHVDLQLGAGEVHAFIGANGAGKSTLAKIISGLVRPDTGRMWLDGDPYQPDGKADAERRGVSIVQQELNLIGTLSVAENLFLNRLPHRRGLIDYRALHDRAARALALVGLDAIDPRTPVSRLGLGHQQLVEIASALSQNCRLLILDEPTAALTDPQIDRLFEHVRRLKASGVGIIYVSHRLEEIRRVADRCTILRDGQVRSTLDMDSFSTEDAVQLMVGREIMREIRPRTHHPGAIALRVERLCRGPLVREVSFEVRRGEILGVAGLVGSGRTELLRAIFGADPAESGSVFLEGSSHPRRFRSPREAVRAGLALVPEDRKQHGLLLPQAVRTNATLGRLAPLAGPAGWIDRTRERAVTRELIRRTDLRCRSMEQPVNELSGGNQQKVLMARWLLHPGNVFLFDEPTRGIDVAAKAAIYHLFHELVAQDKALVAVSSDLVELMAVCDRIAVMARGRLVADFARGDWSQERILAAALRGGDPIGP